MLSFAAILPHAPVTLPQVGKDNCKKLKKTITALNFIAKELAKEKPDTIIIISPHGDLKVNSFTINTNEKYLANFKKFGDFSTELKFFGDISFINKIREKTETKMPLFLTSDPELDHGVSIPLFFINEHYKDFKIVPITYSLLSYEKHLEFGELLKEEIFNTDKKVALIASGDLSHRLTFDSPEGFSPKAKEFDKKLIQQLKKKNIDNILNMDEELIKEAGECGLRSILILLGVIKKTNYDFEVLSYESPFGVGYLVSNFKLDK